MYTDFITQSLEKSLK